MTEQVVLATDEQETLFTIEATDRHTVSIFSNDRVYQKRFAKLGIEPYLTNGYGSFYRVSLEDFSFGLRRKRMMSEEQRQAARERFLAYRSADDDEDIDDDGE